jgi:hypothetical protein
MGIVYPIIVYMSTVTGRMIKIFMALARRRNAALPKT